MVAEWLDQFQHFVRDAGPIGYILYIVVYAICCVLLVPASALTLGAGAIFGFVRGALVVLAGATLGASGAFLLARTALRSRVEKKLAGSPRLAAIDRAVGAEGVKVMLLMRLSGFPPFTRVNYALGLTAVSLRSYLWTTVAGMIPGLVLITWAGAAGAAAITGTSNRIALVATIAGAVLVSVVIARIAHRAIRRAGVEQ